MADNPYAGKGMSITLKQDGKDGTWAVFHGTVEGIREQIEAFFGYDRDEELKPFDVVLSATQDYKASGRVASGLGGRTLGASKSADAFAAARGEAPAAPAEPVRNPLYDTIEQMGSVEALRTLWAENRAAFDAEPELMAAWNAKGKSLVAAG